MYSLSRFAAIRMDSRAWSGGGRWCLDWCFNRLEDGKFGDQKYLDQWPRPVWRPAHPPVPGGRSHARRTLSQYEIGREPRGAALWWMVSHSVFYHFHQFRILQGWQSSSTHRVCFSADRDFPAEVYLPYTRAILTSHRNDPVDRAGVRRGHRGSRPRDAGGGSSQVPSNEPEERD